MCEVTIPLAVAVFGGIVSLVIWSKEQKEKRTFEEYRRKERKYTQLLKNLKGFYVDSFNTDDITAFMDSLNLCWLYCPDEVVKKGYEFLSKVHTNAKYSDEEKELALGSFVLAIRKDLMARKPLNETKLKAEDFKHLKANPR